MGTKEKVYRIVAGPSIDYLIDSFKYLYSTVAKISIEFSIMPEEKPTMIDDDTKEAELLYVRNVKITAIQHKGKSFGTFNLRGVCDADVRIEKPQLPLFYKTCGFIAHYNTDTGRGIIAFE